MSHRRVRVCQHCASGLPRYETEKDFMRRVVYIAALALMAMLVLAPGAMAQQMNHQHMMPNGQMMDDNMMASPSASASASPSAATTLPLLGVIITEAVVAPPRQLLAAGFRAPMACLWCPPWCRS